MKKETHSTTYRTELVTEIEHLKGLIDERDRRGGKDLNVSEIRQLAENARAAGEDTFTYGLMHQRQACRAATIEQALPRFTAARRDRTTGY